MSDDAMIAHLHQFPGGVTSYEFSRSLGGNYATITSRLCKLAMYGRIARTRVKRIYYYRANPHD